MRIIRHPLDAGFTVLPNQTLRDPNLSLKSKGLLGLMLSHTDGFNCTIEHMQTQCSDRRGSIQAGLRELRAAGYVMQDIDRGRSGRIRTVLIVSSLPRFSSDTAKAENPQKSGHKTTQTADFPAGGKAVGRQNRRAEMPSAIEEQGLEEQGLEDQNTTTRLPPRLNWPADLTDQEKAMVVVELEKLEAEEQQQRVVDLLASQLNKGRKPAFLGKWTAALVQAAGAGQLVLDAYAREQARIRSNRAASDREQALRRAKDAERERANAERTPAQLAALQANIAAAAAEIRAFPSSHRSDA